MSRLGRLLVNRNYARLWSGQAISQVGDFVFDTTLIIWIATDLLPHSRWAPAAVSALTLCVLVATVVVGPIAGVFVDRLSHRAVMLGSETLRGFLVLALTLITFVPRHDLPTGVWLALVYVVVFVVNAAGQFFNPARFAAIGEIVADEGDRAQAFGLGQATTATAAIIGPPLAAPLLITVGIQWALLVNALSYGVSYLAIQSVRFPESITASGGPAVAKATAARRSQAADTAATGAGSAMPPPPSWRAEFLAGLRMFAHNRFLVALLIIAVTAQLGTGAVTALNVFFLTGNLHAKTSLLGLLEMGFGIGTIVGAVISGMLVKLLSSRTVVWTGLICSGVLFGLYARQTSFVPGLITAIAFMIPVAALNTAIAPLLLRATPKAYLGRMMAVFNPINMAASTISVLVAGSLASTSLRGFHGDVAGLHIGSIDLIFTVSALLIVLAGIFGSVSLPPAGTEGADGDAPAVPSQAASSEAIAIDPEEPLAVIEPAVAATTAEAEVEDA